MSATDPGARPRDFRVGRGLSEKASAHLANPREQVDIVPPRLASTVLLVRDGEPDSASSGASGVEVFMIRRVPTMEFAPSMWVFPGGGVDARDAETAIPWAGPSPQEWAARIDVAEPVARQLVIAAVREVFEECGVLLAGPHADSVVGDLTAAEWAAERAALLAKEQSLAQMLSRRKLVLRSDLLSLRDHWVTPPFEPRRYDTYFFAALLPTGQIADDATTEADQVAWVRPEDALARVAAQQDRMMPPTIVNVERVGRARSAAAFVAHQPQVLRVMPEPVVEGDSVVLRAQLPENSEPT
ncbi:NUDIX hydrolase [Demetria terragena]|uniref:NUDIX hydrolase n=1 Tax=Demetria terragena TaxID=63959 RepID=UPI0003670DE3|nr:NUDIX hydrolase [Demetria terragena]